MLTGVACRHGEIGEDVRDAIVEAWRDELRADGRESTVAFHAAPAP